MKRFSFLFVVSLMFLSCATPRVLFLDEATHETALTTYDVVTVSKSSDFFRVYKLNGSEYAVLPFRASKTLTAVDDIPNCIIMTQSEAKEFKNGLSELVTKCETSKNEVFFSDLKVREKVVGATRVVQNSTATKKSVSTTSLVDTALIIQATARDGKKLEISGFSKFSPVPFTLTVNDLKNLISALEK